MLASLLALLAAGAAFIWPGAFKERPRARGLVVPGMPVGSPGMEGTRRDAFEVLLVDDAGSTRSYARY